MPQDELSPWFDSNFAPLDEVIKQVEGLHNRRYIKTHCPMDGIRFFDEVRYIFVGRDGRDVFMSMWNHWHNLRPQVIDALNNSPEQDGPTLPYPGESLNDAFDEWLERGSFEWEEDGYPFWSHFQHAQSWWNYRHLPNILFVHFDDLLRDLDGEMRRISAYLGVPVDEAIWPDLLHGVSFGEMKSNAQKMAPGANHATWKDSGNFFHTGTNQRWRGALTDAQSRRYEQLAVQRMEPALRRWLAGGGSVPGEVPS